MPYTPTDELAHYEGARADALSSYRNLLGERDGKLRTARTTNGPGSDRWNRADDKLRTAERNHRVLFGKLQRPSDGRQISFWWFVIGAVLLAALEAPINKFMLDNILRGSNFDSYVLSLFMTLILLVLAHFAGQQARQIHGHYEETIYYSNIVIVALVLIVLAVCVGALTIGRAFYSSAPTGVSGQDIFSHIGKEISTVGPWAAFVKALSDKSAFFLACLNTAGITVAFLAAFVTHDSDKLYQSTIDAVHFAENALSRVAKRYERMVARIERRYGPRLGNIAAAYGAHNAKVVELQRNRGMALSDHDNLDLTTLDKMLEQARKEIGERTHHNGSRGHGPEDDAQTVSPFPGRRS
jgi:uncharacterized membrane protein YidH (DUF202 family)